MNDNIVDFMKILEEKKVDEFRADVVAGACLLALIDITQDVNQIVRLIQITEANGKETTRQMVKKMNAEGAYIFEQLLRQHTDNLDSICKFIGSVEECGDDSALQAEELSEIANEYATSGATCVEVRLNEIVSHILSGKYIQTSQ